MPEVSKDQLTAMLDKVPESEHEQFLTHLKGKGYTLAGATPTPQKIGYQGPPDEGIKEVLPSDIGNKYAGLAADKLRSASEGRSLPVRIAGKTAALGANIVQGFIPSEGSDLAMMMAGPLAIRGLSEVPIIQSAGEKLGQATGQILEKAKSMGIPMSIADITKSPAWSKLESTLAKTPFGAGPISAFRDKQVAAARSALESLAEKLGPSQEVKAMGVALKNAIAERSMAVHSKAKELYDAVGSMVPNSKMVPTDNLSKVAQGMLGEINQLPLSMQDGAIKALVTDLSSFKGQSWQALNTIRSHMMQQIAENDAGIAAGVKGLKFQSNPVAGAYKRLVGPLEDDLAAFGKNNGGKVNDAIELARHFYKGAKSRFDSNIVRRITKHNPEDVVNYVLKPNAITEINALKKAAGPEAFKGVKRAFIDKLFSAGPRGQFSSEALQTTISKFGNSTMKSIFKDSEIKDLEEFQGILSRLQTAEKMSGNPSGTAQNVITYAQGALTVKNPIAGGVVGIGQNIAARLMTSDFARRAFMDGLKTPKISSSAARITTALINSIQMAKRQQYEDDRKKYGLDR